MSGNWTQVGGIGVPSGFTNNQGWFGQFISLSGDCKCVAVSAPQYFVPGYVIIYGITGNIIGNPIVSESIGDYFGWSVSLGGNCDCVAVGVPGGDNFSGYVKIYGFTGGTWAQLGNTLSGGTDDYFGVVVSLSNDCKYVAAAGALYSPAYVKIYEKMGETWGQKGNTLYGATGDHSISLSGDCIAIGALPLNNVSLAYAQIYGYTGGTWTQIGDNLPGNVVSLSDDCECVAVGEPYADGERGYVRIYEKTGGTWAQKGNTLYGGATGDKFGNSVSLSDDCNCVAVGNLSLSINNGYTRIYGFTGGTWIQIGDTLPGSFVSLSDDCGCVAIGEPAGFSTKVRTYNFVIPPPITIPGALGSQTGYSVALSCDATHFAVGSPDTNTVRIYGGAGHTLQIGQTLTSGIERYGSYVALSADGSVAAISGKDFVEIYKEVGDTSWVFGQTLPGGTLEPSPISLNYNGNIIAIGDPSDYKVSVFKNNGGSWASINVINGITGEYFGQSVSLSCNGERLAIGAPGSTSGGRVIIYEGISGSTYSQIGSTSSNTPYYGVSVSLSGDGKRVAVGDVDYGGGTGKVQIYHVNSGGLSLISQPFVGGELFGWSVSLNKDGKILAVGEPSSNGNTLSQVQIFYEDSYYGWISGGPALTSPSLSNYLGNSVSLSGDGKWLGVGAPYNGPTGGTGYGTVYNLGLSLNDNMPFVQSDACECESGSSAISSPVLGNICFPAFTPVDTDQGVIAIDKIIPGVHTINKKRIVEITKTIYTDKHLVCFEKDSVGNNVPSAKTVMTKNHKVIYKNLMTRAADLIGNDGIYKVKYKGEVLYNVLMDTHDEMTINGLVCETLNPYCDVAKMFKALRHMSPEQRNAYIAEINHS